MKDLFTASIWVQNTIIWNEGCCLLPVYEYRIQLWNETIIWVMKVLFTASLWVQNTIIWDEVYCQYMSTELFTASIWVQNTIIWNEGVVYCQYMSTEYNYMEGVSFMPVGVVYCQYMSTEYNYMEWMCCLLPVYEYRIQLYEMKVLFTASILVENTIKWDEGFVYCKYMSTEYNYMGWRSCLLPVYEYRMQLYGMKVLFTASLWVQNTIIWNEGVVYCQYMSTECNYMEWRCCLLPVYEYRIQLYETKVSFTASIWVENTIICNEGVVYCQYMSTEYNYMEWMCCLLPVYEYRIQLYGMKELFTASILVENTIKWDDGFVYCQYMSTEYNYMGWRSCLLPVYEYRMQLNETKVSFTASIWVENTIKWDEGVVYWQYMSTEYNYMKRRCRLLPVYE